MESAYQSGSCACSQCGHRQEGTAACAACGSDTVHDLRRSDTRELLEGIDARRRDRLEGQIRAVAVVASIAVVVALWMVPGYWRLRGRLYPGLPLLADQIIFMCAIAYGLLTLGEARLQRPRFPYLAGLPPPER